MKNARCLLVMCTSLVVFIFADASAKYKFNSVSKLHRAARIPVLASVGGSGDGLRNTFNQFVAGAISGSIGLVVGHPFDTVKTRQQMAPPGVKISALAVAKDIIKNEGILSFMKGIQSPLAMTAFTNAMAFMGYGIGLQLVKPGSSGKPSQEYSYLEHFLAGAFSGALQACVMSPTQLIKCKLQIQTGKKPEPGQVIYNGPVDCVMKIIEQEGLEGLFKGLWITTLRDMWGFAVYYWCYQYCKNALEDKYGMAASYAQMISGAVTGVVAWVAEYPLDVLKTRIQCQPPTAPKATLSIMHQTKELWREGGLLAFYVGVGTAIARAVPVDAALFYSYEVAVKYLNILEDKLFLQ